MRPWKGLKKEEPRYSAIALDDVEAGGGYWWQHESKSPEAPAVCWCYQMAGKDELKLDELSW